MDAGEDAADWEGLQLGCYMAQIVQKEPNMCKLDTCQRDVFVEPKTGIRHDFCGRLHTRRIAYNTDR